MRASFAIFAGSHAWSVASIMGDRYKFCEVELGSSLQPQPEQILSALAGIGYCGQPLLLGLPSQICFAASIDSDGLRNRGRDAAMAYRFEEQIPLAIEEVVLDIIPRASRSMGIAVVIDSIGPMIRSLEAVGIAIASVCPTALLVAREAYRRTLATEQLDAVMCELQERFDLVEFQEGVISNWTVLDPASALLQIHICHANLNSSESLRLRLVGISSAQLPSALSASVIEGDKISSLELASTASARILAGVDSPPVELRRGPLRDTGWLNHHRLPLGAVMVAAVVLCLCLAGAVFWRARQYEQLAHLDRIREEQAFLEAFPGQTIPISIKTRLLSEWKRVASLRGTASAMPPSLSVLPLLHDTLTGLPANLRFRLLELRVDSQRVYLEGQTIDHSAANQIAAALRVGGHLQVDAPHTDQPAGEDVSFTLSATATVEKPGIGRNLP